MVAESLSKALVDSIASISMCECTDEMVDDIASLLAEPLGWFLSHPNWPSGLNAPGRIPIEISLALAGDGPPTIRFCIDVKDHRQGMLENWSRYLDYAKRITDIPADQSPFLWDLLSSHLNGVPFAIRTLMLHGVGYRSSKFRRASLYFNMGWLPYSKLKIRFPEYGSVIERNLNHCSGFQPPAVEWISHDFVGSDVVRTKFYWQLDPTDQPTLSDLAGQHPDLSSAANVFSHFRTSMGVRPKERSIGLQLGFNKKEKMCRQKLFFSCHKWGWHQSKGLLSLIRYLSDTFFLDLEPLYEFLGVFSHYRIQLKPTLVTFGPGGTPPPVTFYFCPVVERGISEMLGKSTLVPEEKHPHITSKGIRSRLELIDEMCARAVDYILTKNSDGYWTDFTVNQEQSDEWVTAYITAVLSDSDDPRLRHYLLPSSEWLRNRFRPKKGWGCSKTCEVDAESTALALLALHRMGEPLPQGVCDVLLQCSLPTGGYCRYTGTQTGQPEITAAVLLAYVETGIAEPDEVRDAVVNLLSQQQKRGEWNAFWWDDDLFAVSRVLQALNSFVQYATSSNGDQLPVSLLDSTVRATRRVRAFISSRAIPSEPIALGLWLKSWAAAHGDVHFPSVDRILCHLYSLQQKDGRWFSVPLRQAAKTNPHQLWTRSHMGGLYLDVQCLITTATVIEGLKAFQKVLASI